MSRVESFTFSKTKTEGSIQKSFGLTVQMLRNVDPSHPGAFIEGDLQQAIARAEAVIDDVLKQPELPAFPNMDLEEINSLSWRIYKKGSESGSAKKGYINKTVPLGSDVNADDLPGWCFREDSLKLAEAIEKAGDKLQIGEWIFTLKGDKKNLINRRKEKS